MAADKIQTLPILFFPPFPSQHTQKRTSRLNMGPFSLRFRSYLMSKDSGSLVTLILQGPMWVVIVIENWGNWEKSSGQSNLTDELHILRIHV